jgi:decaprenylphospho-beta-D-ribofuranose 2-oxidase
MPARCMSAPERTIATRPGRVPARPPAAAGERRQLCGWGRTAYSEATVIVPRTVEQVREAMLFASANGGLIARGAGRSYGDAAQNDGGTVLDLAHISKMEMLDGPLLRAGAGTRLSAALRSLAAVGLTLPVLPGTRHITVGGAIAADVHGKNHRRDGSFGHHVESLLLCTPDGELHRLSRLQQPDLFHATLGGMGLTGVIVEATLRPDRLAGPLLHGDIDRTSSIEQALSAMRQDAAYRYSIAWVDLIGRGCAFGRSVVLRCYDRDDAADPPSPGRIALPGRPRLGVPERFPSAALRPATVRAFNALRFNRAPAHARDQPIAHAQNFFPLDALAHWNRLYGAAGLLQYQFVVPENRAQMLVEIVEGLRRADQTMYLAVIKRFGEPSGGLMSFPMPGWTLAVDLPAGSPGLRNALRAADEMLLGAGGRVYLAKDARLGAEHLPAMYPALERFKAIRSAVDPEGTLRSDMARRLGLAGATA